MLENLKSFNIDPLLFNAVLRNELPDTTKVGTGKTEDGRYVSLFLSFDRVSGDIHTSQDGKRVRINIKYGPKI